ncbi:hypothetical protein [Phaeacidiphilus oryzae]|jgi:mRNA-degrading endonuclease RelE of RelBE toxin-antitoxin system|uniref:hypothetical protein n=1 Tax=Phaeacidiphilus oryzae TaxID=348818 RepID=UPI00055A3D5C|nr:hypothetical protein [Phaeacidiphilus oryzae]
MRYRVEYTERAARLRDFLPADDRRRLLRLVRKVAEDPYGPGTGLRYTNDELTRASREDSAMVEFIVIPSRRVVYVLEADIYDAPRGYNVI